MMGSDLGESTEATAPDSSRAAGDALRQLIMQVGQLAQQLPEASQELSMAARALTQASLKVVASAQTQPTGQPMIGS